MQCMAGAMTAGAAATGVRAWLAGRLSPQMLKRISVGLLTLAVLAAATLSGSGG
jgi:hypothetical protein